MIFEKKILNLYRSMMFRRCDDDGTAFYFSASDFPGLNVRPYPFTSSLGHKMSGYLYSYSAPVQNRIIIFDHGFGGGHRSYMKEIEMLSRRGYLVFAYDHTGCMESGGESPRGMAQSLCDLNDAVAKIKSDPEFFGFDISVVGHSWGGFSTMNICAFHPEISHVVVLSGFVSVTELVNSYFSGIMKGYRGAVMALERETNPKYSLVNGVDSLLKSDTKALLIYSENDKLCKKTHYDILKDGLSEKENVKFILVFDKGHNPNYTKNAVLYLNEYLKEKSKLLKKKKLVTEEEKRNFVSKFDWNKMTEQDEAVFKEIFDWIEK